MPDGRFNLCAVRNPLARGLTLINLNPYCINLAAFARDYFCARNKAL